MKLNFLPPAALVLAGALCGAGPLAAQANSYQEAQPEPQPNQQPAPAGQSEATTNPKAVAPGADNRWQQQEQSRLRDLTRILNLTPDQQASARRIFHNAWQQSRTLEPQMRQERQEMRSLFMNSTTTRFNAEVGRIAQRQGQLYAQMMENHMRAMKEFYSTLTPEQKARAEALHDLLSNPFPFQGRRPGTGMGGMRRTPTE